MFENEDDFSPTPPDINRIAARALVLAATTCRGSIEKDAHKQGAEILRQDVINWLSRVGIVDELESSEATLLSTPLGNLEEKATKNATWQCEGMVVLAWALNTAELPPVQTECDAVEVANAMGFLAERGKTVLHSPRLRDSEEIDLWADTYLTLHWRLRRFKENAKPINFVEYVSTCTWGPLRLDHLEILDSDLAIGGERIGNLERDAFRRTLGITQERRQAFNWLLGFEKIYSQVTIDT